MAVEEGGDGITEHRIAGWQRGGDASSASFYWQGNDTLKVPRSLHAKNRKRLVELMKRDPSEKSIALLAGGVTAMCEDTDREKLFRQESNFHYLFGVAEPDCLGTIDTSTGAAILFIPRLPQEYAVWMGSIASADDFKTRYEIDEVRYIDEIASYMEELKPHTIYVYSGVNTDSGSQGQPASFEGIDKYKVDKEVLHEAIFEARVVKSDEELAVMRFANKMSSQAHIAVMRQVWMHLFANEHDKQERNSNL
jgi:Xaa-Pro dipeptidase